MDVELVLSYLGQEATEDNYEKVIEATNHPTRLGVVNNCLSRLAIIDSELDTVWANSMVLKVDDISLDYHKKYKMLRREAYGLLALIGQTVGLDVLTKRYGQTWTTSYIG